MTTIETAAGKFIAGTLAFLLSLATATAAAPAQGLSNCTNESGWSDPTEPFRIHGNTWYVGTCGISAVLVTSSDGHVLIDAATAEAGKQIVENIRTLGFEPGDVRYIVFSHEHHDHVGGLAEVQRATGAPVLAREAAAQTLRRGSSDRNDPQFLSLEPFPPVAAVRVIADDARVKVGALVLQAVATPGHTPGSTSWSWQSCEGNDCLQMVYADSLTAISDDAYRYSDAGVAERFRETLTRVANLPCDILITPHPSASGLLSRLRPDASEPLVNADACRDYAAAAGKRLEARLAEEAAAETRER